MTLYNIKRIGTKRKIVWNIGRNRGIREYTERIGNFIKHIETLLKKKEKIRILDIGCGYGKVLIELRKKYGNKVEIYGMNLEREWNSNIIEKFALINRIFSKKELRNNLPKIKIGDAGRKIPYPNNYFDIIISVASMQYIKNKAKAIEEINRVMSKCGIAIIELQEYKKKYSSKYKNLFEIINKNEIINSIDWLRRFGNIKIEKGFREWHNLIMKKSKKLDLHIKLINSTDVKQIDKNYTGTKSIFKVEK